MKILDNLKRGILQVYGYEALFLLHNLEKCGMLYPSGGRRTDDGGGGGAGGGFMAALNKMGTAINSNIVWAQIKRQFNLVVEDNEMGRDISFAYSIIIV